MTLSSGLMQSYSIEPAKVAVKKHTNFDGGISSLHHPVVMKVFNGKSKVKTNIRKREQQVDNVRGEMMPKSREDIHSIRRVSYHGKMSPHAEALVGEFMNHGTKRSNTTKLSTTTTKRPTKIPSKKPVRRRYKSKKVVKSPAKRADRVYLTTKKFKPSQKIPNSSEKFQKILPSKKFEKPVYIPDDTPFYPLMRPSPINLLPTDPPSFDTVRNYVRYLKLRNDKNYADIHSDEDNNVNDRSSSVPLSLAQKKSNAPYEGEIDYFKEREKQLVEEQKPEHNQFSPASSQSSSDESSSSTNDNNKPYKVQEEDDDDYDDDESVANNSDDYSDANQEESQNKEKNFVPFKLYAQVRHVESESHEKVGKPKMKEKITLAKKNIYYKEEGYDDEEHDRSSAELKYKRKETKKEKKRSKRSVEMSDLPMALAYIKKSELPNLTGEKLLRHIDELIKNSSIFLPDDDDEAPKPIKIVPARQSRIASKNQKFPYYNLSDNILSQMSAHRYSENFHAYPRQKESLYTSKNIKQCQEIDDEVDFEPSSDEESPPPRRLKKLGSKIECLKQKYFGKDPFDNPLFKEDEYVTAAIPLPFNHTNVISRQANPLINVYDDVIRTIRAENYAEETKKNQEIAYDSVKLASENVPVRASALPARIPNYSSVSGVSQLPIFDINKYLPKFKPSVSINDDDDIDITELLYGKTNTAKKELPTVANQKVKLTPPTQQTFQKANRPNSINGSYKTDASSLIEKPKVKRNYKSSKPSSSVNERVPPLKASSGSNNKKQVTIQKFRRVTPQHKSHSPTRSSYRFKLL